MAEKVVFQSSFFFNYPNKSAVGAIIEIIDAVTGEYANTYTDLAGANSSKNPSKINDDSFFQTFLDPGRYNIIVTDGFQSIALEDIPVGLDGRLIDDVSVSGEVNQGDQVLIFDDSAGVFKSLSLSDLQAMQP